jgi:hypothetical protein
MDHNNNNNNNNKSKKKPINDPKLNNVSFDGVYTILRYIILYNKINFFFNNIKMCSYIIKCNVQLSKVIFLIN